MNYEDLSPEALIMIVGQLAEIQKKYRISHLKVGNVEMVSHPEPLVQVQEKSDNTEEIPEDFAEQILNNLR